jgi:hypothetical protein
MTEQENNLLSEYKSICENAYMPSSASNVLAGRCTEKAMEYAKQQAIAFAQHMFQNIWHMNGMSPSPYVSHDQLYSRFIEQQTENK